MIGFLISFLVVVLIAALVLYVAGEFVTDAFFLKMIRVIVVVAVLLFIIYSLMNAAPVAWPGYRR